MLSTLLLAVLVAAPHVSSPSLDLSGGARVAQFSGALDWSRSWQDLTLSLPSGIPAPTISCVAAASGGELTCTGATASKQGNPTTGTGAGYPEQASVVLDGTGDYYDLGDVGNQTGSFTVSGTVRNGAASSKWIFGRDNGSVTRSFLVFSTGATIQLYVWKADATSCTSNTTAVPAGHDSTFAYTYEWVADGTSKIRGNLNGTAVTEKTNCAGPPTSATASQPLLIGRSSVGSGEWVGSLSAIQLWTNWAATAAELATLVASQQARLASKPANALVTVTSGATKAWGASGTVYSLPANSLAPSPTGAGMEIWSAAQHSNALATSTTAGWTGSAAAAADAAGPDGSATSATTITGDAADSEHYVAQDYTGTAVAWVDSVDLKVEAGWAFVSPDGGTSGVYVNRATCALGTSTTLTSAVATLRPGSAWCNVQWVKTLSAATKSFRIYIAEADGDRSYDGAGTETLTFYAPAAQIGVVAGPPTVSAGTPVVGAPDLVKRPTSDIPFGPFCTSARFVIGQSGLNQRITGIGDAANRFGVVLTTATRTLRVDVFDAANNQFSWSVVVPEEEFVAGAEAVLTACYNHDGTAAVRWNGIARTVTATSGAGTGLLSAFGATDFYIGSSTFAGTLQLNSSMKVWRVCKGASTASARACEKGLLP